MDLFEVLKDRVIVHSHEETRQIITWNRSCTFQLWNASDSSLHEFGDGTLEEVDIITSLEVPSSYEHACKKARGFFQEKWNPDA